MQLRLLRIFRKWEVENVVWIHVVWAGMYVAVQGSRVV
jgi:hypothetical protein